MKTRSILAAVFGLVAVGGLCFMAWILGAPSPLSFGGKSVALADYRGPSPVGVPAEFADTDIITRGEYLTRAADCAACHTAKGGKEFAGGRAFKLPFGTIYSPNITPDTETGIGKWTDAEFLRAVHEGIGRQGEPLYPAFPYPSYTALTDGDVLAIKAYLFARQPVHLVPPANTLIFPFNQRSLMRIWSLMFNPDKRFEPVPARSAEWNRGAYLAEALGHCGECHSPRNVMQAIDNRSKFGGGHAEGWLAYNITNDKHTGIGDWTADELAHFLSAGHAVGRGTGSGPMGEAVDVSLSYLVPNDIHALVTYLRTVPPVHGDSVAERLARPAATSSKSIDGFEARGKQIFEGACVSCHAWTGAGSLREQAALTGARSINDVTGTNVVQMVLAGTGPVTGSRPYMPGFGRAYSDQEVADVANYVTRRFGSEPSHLTAEQVAKMRAAN
jgi:mono/diheme cytochrome c family protein